MAYNANAGSLAQLQLIKRRPLSEQESNVLNAFALAIPNLHAEPGASRASDAAIEAAHRLNSLCPSLDHKEDARDYLWRTWEIMLDIASSPEVEDNVHGRLLTILEELLQCAKGELDEKRVWRDLPGLADCFDASYTNPTCEGEESFTTEAAQIWHKLSSFGARGMAAGVLAVHAQAMYAVQSALEEPLDTLSGAEVEMAGWRVKVACAWLTHGAKPLLWWARENESYGNEEDGSNYIKRGPLYDGPAIMCIERWRFWLHRLQVLAKEESGLGEEIRVVALQTVQTMRKGEESTMKAWL
ncbi:uncharacterized protein B0T15DRAFT_94137 [Chaetomium strumarium]|uniref:Uncharacterized protein n=1 Tax=Chaetomium strumarium TaxID=1170767 RepID=A0AAJ0GXK1_9PEZI|nr:hypothetical protein B0T15DRAFT_94137 [Chaetomium strumarium]